MRKTTCVPDVGETIAVQIVRRIDESYGIYIGRCIGAKIEEFVNGPAFVNDRIAIIADNVVIDLFSETLFDSLKRSGRALTIIGVEGGEATKTRKMKADIEDQLLADGFGRDSLIIAVGGGVVTDIAGFVAATFTRGIPWIAVPTTVLAAADVSVGGKTAIDTPAATNMIGAFHQPSAVFVDLDVWGTLPDIEVQAGLAETVKHACFADRELFESLEDFFVKQGKSVRDFIGEHDLCQYVASRNCRIKAHFVSDDPTEGNQRMVLNLGHTFGRAIEAAADYAIPHGQAVAIGLTLQAQLGERLGYIETEVTERLTALLEAIGLPTEVPVSISIETLLTKMHLDKKSRKGSIRFVFQDGIGSYMSFEDSVSLSLPDSVVRDFLSTKC